MAAKDNSAVPWKISAKAPSSSQGLSPRPLSITTSTGEACVGEA